MLVIDRVELKILQHVEKVVIFDHDDAALADKPLHAENGFSQGGHVSEDVGRRDERRVSMRGDDVAGALLVEERLNGFDAVVLGDGGNVGRLDAEHTRAGIFEPREQGAVVRSDVHDEISGAEPKRVHESAAHAPEIVDERRGDARAVRVFPVIDDVAGNDVVQLAERAGRTPHQPKRVGQLRLGKLLLGEQGVAERLMAEIDDLLERSLAAYLAMLEMPSAHVVQ
jgi:hypothetical protein